MYCIMKRKSNEKTGSCIGDFPTFEEAENFVVRINRDFSNEYIYYIEEELDYHPPKYKEYKKYYDDFISLNDNCTYFYYEYYVKKILHIALYNKNIKTDRLIQKVDNKYYITEPDIKNKIPSYYAHLEDVLNISNQTYSIYIHRRLKDDEFFKDVTYQGLKMNPNKLIICKKCEISDDNIELNDKIIKYLQSYIKNNLLTFFSGFERCIYRSGTTYTNEQYRV